MTLWDYLDKHEIIGTGLIIIVSFFIMATATDVFVAFAKAWGARGSKGERS